MANLPIIGLQDQWPEGEFHLPVCINRADLYELLSDLQYSAMRQQRTETPAWNRILNALAYLDDPQNAPCNPAVDFGGCQEVPASYTTVDYAPNDPRIPGQPVPPNYLDNPWYMIGSGTASPYHPGDIMTDISKMPVLANLPDLILNTGLPTITIHAEGAGEVELELIKIPTGGFAMITVDDNPLTVQFIPMNSLSISFTKTWWLDVINEVLEGDLFAAEKHEIKLTGSGAHVIRIVAVPEIGGETIIGFGFGLRSVTYCGFPDVCEECVDMNCADVLACIDDTPQWQILDQQMTGDILMTDAEIINVTQIEAGERELIYDGTPQSIMNAPIDVTNNNWNNNPGWCEAASAFVQATFAAKISQLNQINGVASVASIIINGLQTLSGGGWLLRLAGWSLLPLDLISIYNHNAMMHLLTDPMILFHTIDGLARENGGKDITFTGFKQLTANGYAWRDTTYPGMAFIKQWLNAEVLSHPIQGERNYQLLLDAVHTANHHKVNLGDPMWCGIHDSWVMNRGADYALTGMQMITGSMNPTQGFVAKTSGIKRLYDILLTSPRSFNFDSWNLSGASATQSPVRPTTLTVMNNGIITFQGSNNFPNSSSYYYGINVDANWIRFTAAHEESGQWILTDPFYMTRLEVKGNGKPPVGFWTPD